jgi:hypothetical protein
VKHVDAAEPGTNDDSIEVSFRSGFFLARLFMGFSVVARGMVPRFHDLVGLGRESELPVRATGSEALVPDSELHVCAESADRVSKERAMRRRQLKWLWKGLRELAAMEISRKEMLMKLGAARSRAPTAWRLVEIDMDRAWWNFQGLRSPAWPAESSLHGRCHADSRGRPGAGS